MNLIEIEKILLKKQASYIDYPFGDEVMVLKIANKMFALVSQSDNPLRVNLKCDPDDAIAYREIYEGVVPGYHMNKKHWNTVILDDTIPKEVLIEMIDDSYNLVFNKLTKKEKEKILSL
jgi:predicted DNA-binding protein (MmcQ/YjbR family)